jgi:hypothetical protein
VHSYVKITTPSQVLSVGHGRGTPLSFALQSLWLDRPAQNITFRYDVIPELSESSQADIAAITKRLAGVPGVPLDTLERLCHICPKQDEELVISLQVVINAARAYIKD